MGSAARVVHSTEMRRVVFVPANGLVSADAVAAYGADGKILGSLVLEEMQDDALGQPAWIEIDASAVGEWTLQQLFLLATPVEVRP